MINILKKVRFPARQKDNVLSSVDDTDIEVLKNQGQNKSIFLNIFRKIRKTIDPIDDFR